MTDENVETTEEPKAVEAEAEKGEEEKVAEKETFPNPVELLLALDNKPSQQQIDAWKGQYGEVFVVALMDESLHVFHAINRADWSSLQTRAAEAAQEGNQLDQEEELVRETLLWSTTPDDLLAKAGTVQSLAGTITEHSNFMDSRLVAALTAKL